MFNMSDIASIHNWAGWYREQLRASGSGVLWGFGLIPDRYRRERPPYPRYLGEWPPARHVWHLTQYERCVALPSMRQWLGDPQPSDGAWQDTDIAWSEARGLSDEVLIAAFRQAREDQILLLEDLAEGTWDERRDTAWGSQPLWKVVAKTFQHTYEHGDTLMRMGLWWEELLEQKARRAAKVESAIDSAS